MSQIANFMGMRVGKKGGFFWSNSLPFFFNRRPYKQLTHLFRYLDWIFRYFQFFTRKIYGRPFCVSLSKYYNFVGMGKSKTLIIDLFFYDMFGTLSTVPCYSWQDAPPRVRFDELSWQFFVKNVYRPFYDRYNLFQLVKVFLSWDLHETEGGDVGTNYIDPLVTPIGGAIVGGFNEALFYIKNCRVLVLSDWCQMRRYNLINTVMSSYCSEESTTFITSSIRYNYLIETAIRKFNVFKKYAHLGVIINYKKLKKNWGDGGYSKKVGKELKIYVDQEEYSPMIFNSFNTHQCATYPIFFKSTTICVLLKYLHTISFNEFYKQIFIDISNHYFSRFYTLLKKKTECSLNAFNTGSVWQIKNNLLTRREWKFLKTYLGDYITDLEIHTNILKCFTGDLNLRRLFLIFRHYYFKGEWLNFSLTKRVKKKSTEAESYLKLKKKLNNYYPPNISVNGEKRYSAYFKNLNFFGSEETTEGVISDGMTISKYFRKFNYRMRNLQKIYLHAIRKGIRIRTDERWVFRKYAFARRWLSDIFAANKLRFKTWLRQSCFNIGLSYQLFLKMFIIKCRLIKTVFSRFFHYLVQIYFQDLFDNIMHLYNIGKIHLNFRGNGNFLSARFVADLLAREIQRGFSLRYLLNQIRFGFHRVRREIMGYKIKLTGRFSRRQMSTYICQKRGTVSPSTQRADVEYAANNITMLYGQCGIKVWVQTYIF